MSEHLFDKVFSVNLTEWARRQGIHPQTAYRWFRNGTLPVPAVRVNARSVLIAPDSVLASPADGLGLYARVSSHDQRADLDRQVARLCEWAAKTGAAGRPSGVRGRLGHERRSGKGPPSAHRSEGTTVVVEHRDRLGRMNIGSSKQRSSPLVAGLWCSTRVRSTTTSSGT